MRGRFLLDLLRVRGRVLVDWESARLRMPLRGGRNWCTDSLEAAWRRGSRAILHGSSLVKIREPNA